MRRGWLLKQSRNHFFCSVYDKHFCPVKNQFIGRWGIGHYYYKLRDRDSSFEWQLIPKRQKDVSEIEEKGFDLLQSKPHTAMAMSWVYLVLSYCLIKPRHIPWQYFCLNFVWIFTLSFLKIPVLSKALQSRSHDIFFGKSFLFHRPYRSQGKLHSHFFLCLSILPLRQHFAKYIRHFHIFRWWEQQT